MAQRILIVEDDQLIAELERDFLEADGFEVVIANDGQAAMDVFKTTQFDAAILDIMLPGEMGFSICREIRKTSMIPILFVTAKKEEVHKIRGFGLGADDYIVKPFSPSELVTRLKAHLSRYHTLINSGKQPENETLTVGDILIDKSARAIRYKNQELSLTSKEFDIFLFLATHPNVVFRKEELFEHIWHMEPVGEAATITVHVNRLRDKLNAIAPFNRIETVWGSGYRFRL